MKRLQLPPEPDLPEQPECWSNVYGTNLTGKTADIPDAGDVMAPRQGFRIGMALENGALSQPDITAINEHRKFLCAYGFVLYADSFGREHGSRFCSIHRVSTRSTQLAGTSMEIDPSRFRIGGSAEYNKQT